MNSMVERVEAHALKGKNNFPTESMHGDLARRRWRKGSRRKIKDTHNANSIIKSKIIYYLKQCKL